MGGKQVTGTSGDDSLARMVVFGSSIDGDTYSIRFYDNSSVPIYSDNFSSTGDSDKT